MPNIEILKEASERIMRSGRVKIPSQCMDCIKRDACLVTDCLKEKECSRRETPYIMPVDEIRY